MKSEEIEYIKYRISRAEEALGDADLLLSRDSLPATVNRIYYACFYTVVALLQTEGHVPKTHHGTRVLLGREWIRTNRLPGEMGDFYTTLFNRRQASDYADMIFFARADVEQWLIGAKSFVDRIKAEIDKKLPS